MIGKIGSWTSNLDKKFGCLIFKKENKVEFLSFGIIGKDFTRQEDVVYCTRKSGKHRNKIIHLDELLFMRGNTFKELRVIA